MEFRDYAPLELLAEPGVLDRLRTDVTAVGLKQDEPYLREVWLRTYDGRQIVLGVNQRDLEFKFEVFGLWLASPEALAANIVRKGWAFPAPKPPEAFETWPLAPPWQVQVLRRAEFIVEDVVVEGALGEDPIVQDVARPGRIPDDAAAQCEVAVGLLFTGFDDARLIIGVDWFPETLVFLRDDDQIAQYLACCETVDLSTYQADPWATSAP
jgi:hypothetical protein